MPTSRLPHLTHPQARALAFVLESALRSVAEDPFCEADHARGPEYSFSPIVARFCGAASSAFISAMARRVAADEYTESDLRVLRVLPGLPSVALLTRRDLATYDHACSVIGVDPLAGRIDALRVLADVLRADPAFGDPSPAARREPVAPLRARDRFHGRLRSHDAVQRRPEPVAHAVCPERPDEPHRFALTSAARFGRSGAGQAARVACDYCGRAAELRLSDELLILCHHGLVYPPAATHGWKLISIDGARMRVEVEIDTPEGMRPQGAPADPVAAPPESLVAGILALLNAPAPPRIGVVSRCTARWDWIHFAEHEIQRHARAGDPEACAIIAFRGLAETARRSRVESKGRRRAPARPSRS